MRFALDIRVYVALRKIGAELQGIREEMRYRNEREFPPLHEKRDVKKTGVVVTGIVKPAKQEW